MNLLKHRDFSYGIPKSGSPLLQPSRLWQHASAIVIQQNINYAHNNSVEAGFVENDYEYLCNSARDYYGITGLIKVIID